MAKRLTAESIIAQANQPYWLIPGVAIKVSRPRKMRRSEKAVSIIRSPSTTTHYTKVRRSESLRPQPPSLEIGEADAEEALREAGMTTAEIRKLVGPRTSKMSARTEAELYRRIRK